MQKARPHPGMRGAQRPGSGGRGHRVEDFGGSRGRQICHNRRQLRRRQPVHGGAGGGELQRVTPGRRQMQIGPVDGLLGRALRQPVHAQASPDTSLADLDRDHTHGRIGPGEQHVGDAGQPLAGDVNDLGVEDVTD